MGDYERIRVVTLGGAGVGKSAIIKRFLFNTFQQKYKPTVEDLYNQEYDFGPVTLKVDILDTAGDLQFPAMRKLSIATAHAFLITYAVDDRITFDLIKGLFEEIREQRADFEDIPIVITGNKIDVGIVNRSVQYDEVCDWLESCWPSLRVKVVDCSAKEDINIRDVFKSFLPLSKLGLENDDAGLKRRSSAHAGSKSPAVPRSPCAVASASNAFFGNSSTSPPLSSTPPLSNSRGGTPTRLNPSSPSYQQFLTEEGGGGLPNKHKQRSRSLMRRSSKKVKQQVRDVSGGSGGPGDCQMS